MNNESLLVDCIKEYEKYIRKGNDAIISRYDLNESPFLAKNKKIIPKSGSFVLNDSMSFAYNFHGIGCKFVFSDFIIVDFDYVFKEFTYKGFEALKLQCFIQSYLEANHTLTEPRELQRNLTKLLNKGIIKAAPINSYNTYDYIYDPSVQTPGLS